MNRFLFILLIASLPGCSTISSIMDKIPSRWDANQAKVITDLRQQALTFDCSKDQIAQLKVIQSSLQWFHLYSESKNTKDVDKLLDTVRGTANEFSKRPQPVSAIYCDIKRKLMIVQVDIAAKAIQGRF